MESLVGRLSDIKMTIDKTSDNTGYLVRTENRIYNFCKKKETV
jgi:hypothetical protein